MAISYINIPSNIRTPLFYAEFDNSMANTATGTKKSLLIGQMIEGGTAKENAPILVTSATKAKTLFGRGSPLALMVEAYKNTDSSGELWCVAQTVTGAAATGTVNLKGTAIEAGTLSLYIGGKAVKVPVAAGATASDVATDLAAAINAEKDLPVSASSQSGSDSAYDVTLTAKGQGTYGNDILLALNRRGYVGGEESLNGIAVTITAMANGTGDVDLEDAFACLGDETYTFVGIPLSDATSLDVVKTEFNDTTGRWAYNNMQYGHVFTAKRDTEENLVTFGKTRNDQHVTVFGVEPNNPEPCFIIAAAATAREAVYISADPARPTQTGELIGLLETAIEDRFKRSVRETLLNNGIATFYVEGGYVRIERAITTYQTNKFGDADNSYLDSETLFTLAEIVTRLKTAVTSKYPRHKLANDGTRYGPGQAIVTPNVIRSELIAQYAAMERDGLVENADLFAKYLIVERNASDPNRVDVLLPPDVVNQLRVFGMLTQFRLQYSENA